MSQQRRPLPIRRLGSKVVGRLTSVRGSRRAAIAVAAAFGLFAAFQWVVVPALEAPLGPPGVATVSVTANPRPQAGRGVAAGPAQAAVNKRRNGLFTDKLSVAPSRRREGPPAPAIGSGPSPGDRPEPTPPAPPASQPTPASPPASSAERVTLPTPSVPVALPSVQLPVTVPPVAVPTVPAVPSLPAVPSVPIPTVPKP